MGAEGEFRWYQCPTCQGDYGWLCVEIIDDTWLFGWVHRELVDCEWGGDITLKHEGHYYL